MPFTEVVPGVFLWPNTCNTYVVRDGDAAIVVDLGDASVLAGLDQIGVATVEWVVYTHHHREQCQGHGRLAEHAACQGAKVAGPAAERELFEQPHAFRHAEPKLSDRFTVHGASYVRPPILPIRLDRGFEKMDTLAWRGRELWCAETGGNSPGGMSYLFREADRWIGFTGDVMLDGARDRLGIRQIDAVLVTHMHGDHFLDAEHVRKTRGAAIWTHERVADLLERPLDYDYDALIPAYRERPTGDIRSLKVDRVIRDGEVIHWRGHDLACDWMPGQTEFACCVHGVIDGKRVAFTGDNIFGAPGDPAQHGHEAVVSRNACTVEEGYGYAGRYLHSIAPDLILGGHSWAIADPRPLIDRFMEAAAELRAALVDLAPDRDYRLTFDPYWLRVQPYRVGLARGGRAEATLVARNFLDVATVYDVRLVCPPGITVAPAQAALRVEPGGVKRLPLTFSVAADMLAGLSLVALDVTHDGARHGQLFDVVLLVS